MRKKIVVCCQAMLKAIADKTVYVDGALNITPRTAGDDFDFCPWCGGKLPFLSEERT